MAAVAFVTIGCMSLLIIDGRQMMPRPTSIGICASLGTIAAVLAIRRDRRDQARIRERELARRTEPISTLPHARAALRRGHRDH